MLWTLQRSFQKTLIDSLGEEDYPIPGLGDKRSRKDCPRIPSLSPGSEPGASLPRLDSSQAWAFWAARGRLFRLPTPGKAGKSPFSKNRRSFNPRRGWETPWEIQESPSPQGGKAGRLAKLGGDSQDFTAFDLSWGERVPERFHHGLVSEPTPGDQDSARAPGFGKAVQIGGHAPPHQGGKGSEDVRHRERRKQGESLIQKPQPKALPTRAFGGRPAEEWVSYEPLEQPRLDPAGEGQASVPVVAGAMGLLPAAQGVRKAVGGAHIPGHALVPARPQEGEIGDSPQVEDGEGALGPAKEVQIAGRDQGGAFSPCRDVGCPKIEDNGQAGPPCDQVRLPDLERDPRSFPGMMEDRLPMGGHQADSDSLLTSPGQAGLGHLPKDLPHSSVQRSQLGKRDLGSLEQSFPQFLRIGPAHPQEELRGLPLLEAEDGPVHPIGRGPGHHPQDHKSLSLPPLVPCFESLHQEG